MATGAPGTNGVWQYGEDDSEATFSALLNKAASTTDTQIGADRTRLTALELPGRVVNTVQTVKTNVFSTNSATYVDVTGMSAAITPKATANKVLVIITFLNSINNVNAINYFKILRGATSIGDSASGIYAAPFANNATGGFTQTYIYLDSPATTSATTYKLQMATNLSATGYVGTYAANPTAASTSTITVMEIDG